MLGPDTMSTSAPRRSFVSARNSVIILVELTIASGCRYQRRSRRSIIGDPPASRWARCAATNESSSASELRDRAPLAGCGVGTRRQPKDPVQAVAGGIEHSGISRPTSPLLCDVGRTASEPRSPVIWPPLLNRPQRHRRANRISRSAWPTMTAPYVTS
jgi:hypothetical protein